MSSRIAIIVVGFAVFSFVRDRVCYGLSGPFLCETGTVAQFAVQTMSHRFWPHAPIANTKSGAIDRIKLRIAGTLVGVPLALACLPFAPKMPLVIWAVAAIAMIVYAMALPERYDIACGAYAFALVVPMAATGEYTFATLAARAWETMVGGALGVPSCYCSNHCHVCLRSRSDVPRRRLINGRLHN